MKCAKSNILHTIGHTPIVRLQHLAKGVNANVFVKCEFMNPGGSIKDRIAHHIVEEAERRGDLKPGGTIIEATSGNTGMGLAMAAGLKGYRTIFVMADKQSEEKRQALRALGAQVEICPTDVAPEDPRSYYEVAKRLVRDTPNAFYANQYYNGDNPEAHYRTTGPEIWNECGEELDVLVCTIGTGGTVSGVSRYLKERKKEIRVIGVDPIGSVYFDLFHTGKMGQAHAYLIEGIGEDFLPETIDMKSMDDVVQVTDEESFRMGRRLNRQEALLCGGSSGSAVQGALTYLKTRHPEGDRPNVLVILPDSNSRYLSKFLDDEWMRAQGFGLD